jgi:asparagine synthase (glutamine-hydrolysing)
MWVSEDGRAALGHRRLAIIDLSERGAQPMVSADRRYVISFNGEIYNYRELRADLEAQGRCFVSGSDTEVLLHLYAMKGEAMVHDLRGMFAFAIWDDERKGLFLARDPFGIKPLYYADDGRTIKFASEVKALLVGGGIDTAAEPAGHVGFFLWGSVPEPYTLYRGIRSLGAGSTLWIARGSHREVREYASLRQLMLDAERAAVPRTESEAREILWAAMRDSVEHHLVADVDVGVFLSAGLDSTTIAALVSETGRRPHTMTLGFREYRDTPEDETELAAQAARLYGGEHDTVWITQADFEAELPRLLDRMDQPTTDGVNSYFVSRAAAQLGLKVALSGLGGDELFAGYPSFQQVPAIVSLLRRVPVVAPIGRGFRLVSASLMKRFTSPKYAGILEYGHDYAGAYLLRRSMFTPWELADVLDRDLLRDGWRELQARQSLANTVDGIAGGRLKVSALEATWYMRNQLLRDTDWASMSHSLEVRVPFVDMALWRAVAPLAANGGGPDKGVMARAPRQPLPDAVLARAKTGFSVPTQHWCDEHHNGHGVERGQRGWARQVYRSHGQVA